MLQMQKPVETPPEGAAVIFDLDGTLVDTGADLLAAANACFSGLGQGTPLDARDHLIAFHGGRAMLRAGFARLGQAVDEAEVTRLYPLLLAHYREAIAVHSRPYPGAVEAVEALKRRGFRVAICTNKPEALARQLLHELRMLDLFAALIGADTLPVRKPDPAHYLAALEGAGGRLAASLMVGDTETDLLTARAVGVPVALVAFGPEGPGIARLKPDALLARCADLPDLAQRLVAGR